MSSAGDEAELQLQVLQLLLLSGVLLPTVFSCVAPSSSSADSSAEERVSLLSMSSSVLEEEQEGGEVGEKELCRR